MNDELHSQGWKTAELVGEGRKLAPKSVQKRKWRGVVARLEAEGDMVSVEAELMVCSTSKRRPFEAAGKQSMTRSSGRKSRWTVLSKRGGQHRKQPAKEDAAKLTAD